MSRMMSHTYSAVAVAVLAASLLVVLLWPLSAQAQSTTGGATITVNTDQDENTPNDQKCSLREAIQNANDDAQTFPECQGGSASGEDKIVFDLGKSATITLDPNQGQLTVTDAAGLSIDGGSAAITVSGANQTRVFEVNGGAQLELKNLTVADGSAAEDFGGGILNNGGTLDVTNSTISGNSTGSLGGGIYNGGTLEVTNSTFSGNSADVFGGGIANGGDLTVANSTFSGNSALNGKGGGIDNGGIAATLSNTIVANSPSGGDCHQFNPITDDGYNIDTDGTCVSAQTSKTTNPQFAGTLANNGGPTQTIALEPGSPAIDAIPLGANGCGTAIKTDQRGVPRPQGAACDVGAFEVAKAAPPPPPGHHKHHHHNSKGRHHGHHKKKHHGGNSGGGGITQG